LLCSLAVVSGSQNLVRHFPFIPNQFLQRESVRIQLLGEMQHLLQICGIRGVFPVKLSTHRGWESNYGLIVFGQRIRYRLYNLTAGRALRFNESAVLVPIKWTLEDLGRTREEMSFGFHGLAPFSARRK
jgi:hypothetical protein